jgi:hypothetical protein
LIQKIIEKQLTIGFSLFFGLDHPQMEWNSNFPSNSYPMNWLHGGGFVVLCVCVCNVRFLDDCSLIFPWRSLKINRSKRSLRLLAPTKQTN